MHEIVAAILWKRLDTPGHDACALARRGDGWSLEGRAVFEHEGNPCALAYTVECDRAWRTRSARVEGNVGTGRLVLDVARSNPGGWSLNGVAQPKALDSVDLDLGFTPATNLIAIRRLKPGTGDTVPAVAAYYLEFTHRLGLIEQTYRRIAPSTIAYVSKTHDYAADLKVAPSGFVLDYPGLWTSISLRETGDVHDPA